MSTKQTHFQEDWLQNVQYSSWLKRKDDIKVAYCAKCQKTIELSNMRDIWETKLTYITNFGIAPYFHQLLIDEFKNCNYYSLSFNGNLNDFTQTCHVQFYMTLQCEGKILYL